MSKKREAQARNQASLKEIKDVSKDVSKVLTISKINRVVLDRVRLVNAAVSSLLEVIEMAKNTDCEDCIEKLHQGESLIDDACQRFLINFNATNMPRFGKNVGGEA